MDNRQTLGRPIGGASVKVAYTGTAGTTAALSPDTKVIRVMATTDCFIRISPAGTAAVADVDMYLPAYVAEYFEGQPSVKVSAIQVSTGGTIYVTPF